MRSEIGSGVVALLVTISLGQFAWAQELPEVYRHKIRDFSYWVNSGYSTQKRIEEKTEPKAFGDLLDYVRKVNRAQGFHEYPVLAPVDPDLARDVRQAIRELPDSVKNLVSPKLLGVFLVRGLGSTGLTAATFDQAGLPKASFVVLDVDAINRKANEWVSWKENSPFSSSVLSQAISMKISMKIETESENTRKGAIQYILLHEFGHVVEAGDKGVVSLDERLPSLHDPLKFRFSSISWRLKSDRYVSSSDKQFPEREKVVFYADRAKLLPVQDSPQIYHRLKQTQFPTLYAATNPSDDFAESFASYVHVVLMHRPYRVEVSQKGRTLEALSSCWEEERCKEKRKILEEYFR